MLGSDLLVAPIFNEQGKASYYLPRGRWQNLLTGEIREGGRWLEETFDYKALPLMVRENSLIPLGSIDARPDYDFSENPVLVLCQIADGASAGCPVCGPDGRIVFTVTVSRQGDRLEVRAEGDVKPFRLLRRSSGLAGEHCTETPWGTLAALSGSGSLCLVNP